MEIIRSFLEQQTLLSMFLVIALGCSVKYVGAIYEIESGRVRLLDMANTLGRNNQAV